MMNQRFREETVTIESKAYIFESCKNDITHKFLPSMEEVTHRFPGTRKRNES
jgi:hypothetical protein